MPPKKPLNSNITKEGTDSPLEGALGTVKSNKPSNLIFTPTPSMKRIKARFWTRYQETPTSQISDVTAAEIAKVTGSAGIKNWWSKDGFKDWFLNKNEDKERISYLFDMSLEKLEDMINDPSVNAGVRLNAIKLLAEMNGNIGKSKKQPERFADEQIEKMSESQLIEFIKEKQIKLVEEKIIEAETSKDGD